MLRAFDTQRERERIKKSIIQHAYGVTRIIIYTREKYTTKRNYEAHVKVENGKYLKEETNTPRTY